MLKLEKLLTIYGIIRDKLEKSCVKDKIFSQNLWTRTGPIP